MRTIFLASEPEKDFKRIVKIRGANKRNWKKKKTHTHTISQGIVEKLSHSASEFNWKVGAAFPFLLDRVCVCVKEGK